MYNLSEILDWDRDKVAVIMPTLKCNIRCEHCILACSSKTETTMSQEQIHSWTNQLINLGFNPICLTGGEPFLFPDLIKETSLLCKSHSVALVIQTNGYWANTVTKAKATINYIPWITQLGFSVDYAHMKFIPKEYILNGIEAAYDSGISNISISISYQTVQEYIELEEFFQSKYPSLVIETWPITPLGRANNNPLLTYDYETYEIDSLPRNCEAQKTFTPIITPEGDFHLCYHLVMLLGKDDPLNIGNLRDQKLEHLLSYKQNLIYEFILAYGGGSLCYPISEIAPSLLRNKYQRVCEFCYHILSDKKLVNQLNQMLSEKEFVLNLNEILEYRKRNSFPQSKREKEKLVMCNGKNCFTNKEFENLRYYLQNRLIDTGKYKMINIECVDCLNQCRSGPNILVEKTGQIVNRVNKKVVDDLLQTFE